VKRYGLSLSKSFQIKTVAQPIPHVSFDSTFNSLNWSKAVSFSSMTNRYSWQDQYQAALMETDREKLISRIISAQAAINGRIREMQATHDGTLEEKQALVDAVSGLQTLRKVTAEN
jgi:hypothetical protein